MGLPLAGIRIVEITVVWAGPAATQLLADWGAEVIRVESRQHWQINTRGRRARPSEEEESPEVRLPWSGGYPNREPGERPWNRFPWFNVYNRNKYSMTVDLTRPEGLSVFKKLIGQSDVFVENNAPGTIEKLGITYEALQEVKPDIIMVRMPPFGLTGPYKNYRVLGTHIGMAAGHASIQGYPDMDSTQGYEIYAADAAAAANAALAMLFALHYRELTGEGQLIEVAQLESFLHQLPEPIIDYLCNGRIVESVGNRHSRSAPCGCFKCRGEERWVNIAVSTDDEWAGLYRAMGEPEWMKEPRFATGAGRCKYQDEIEKQIEAWTGQQDNYEVMARLQGEGVPAGPVMDEKDCFNDPHLRERGFFQQLTQADCGTHLYPGLGWKLSKTSNKLRKPPVRLGEDNEYIYKKVIGVSDEEYRRLTREGHIGIDFIEDIP